MLSKRNIAYFVSYTTVASKENKMDMKITIELLEGIPVEGDGWKI
jgi:hypothetical protein